MRSAKWALVAAGVVLTGAAAVLAALGWGGSLQGASAREEDKVVDPDEALLQEAQVGTDGAALLDYLRQQTGDDDDLLGIDRLIGRLGSDDVKEREEASGKLTRLGLVALPALREAAKSDDAEVRKRAGNAVEQIVRDYRLGVPLAAVRTLLRRQPEGTVKTLVGYLPYAGDEAVEEEIYFGLYDLTAKAKTIDGALSAALTNKLPARRALAACIVGRLSDAEQRKAVRKLFDDADATVRLRAAQALLAAEDKDAIPILVKLLGEPVVAVSWQAEELLHWAAGDSSPQEVVGAAREEDRVKCSESWDTWFRKNGAATDLASHRAALCPPRLVLVCYSDINEAAAAGDGVPGRVCLLGSDGKARWQLKRLHSPRDARFLIGDRVLVAEESALRVTERDLEGEVTWHYELQSNPRSCERLPNGNTYIAATTHATEISPDGQILYRRKFANEVDGAPFSMTCDQPMSRQRILGCYYGIKGLELLAEFDRATGKEFRRVALKGRGPGSYRVESVPGGGFLIASCFGDEVFEIDGSGKEIRSQHVPRPNHAIRLRNGDMLVAYGRANKWRLREIANDGRVVWEAMADGLPTRVRVCLGLVRLGFEVQVAGQDRSAHN
jgi:hypothetical protein